MSLKQQAGQKIYIIGIGMGNPDTLTIKAAQTIADCHCLIGARRMLEAFPDVTALKHEAIHEQDILAFITAHPELQTIGVLMSGDVGFYSGGKKLVQHLADYDVELISGISSVVYFCAKLKTPWDDVRLLSAHGRDCNIVGSVMNHPKVFMLTGGQQSANTICQTLCAHGLEKVLVHVGERLSYEDERVVTGTAVELQHQAFAPLSVMLIENANYLQRDIISHGLGDEEFIRGDVPMTKSEVRTVSIAKLQLKSDAVLYDVGAGTGSVAVEMALQARNGMVFAIEKQADALSLLQQNKDKFNLANLQIVSGNAPAALAELPSPDGVFIGGSSGQMGEIIRTLLEKNPQVRVVINAIALETLGEGLEIMNNLGFEQIEVVQVAISKGKPVGKYHMMTAQNPIFILSGRGNGNEL